ARRRLAHGLPQDAPRRGAPVPDAALPAGADPLHGGGRGHRPELLRGRHEKRRHGDGDHGGGGAGGLDLEAASMRVLAGWEPPGDFEEYRIVRPLGQGTMGRVYLAHDTFLDRPVAIKFLAGIEPAARERFFAEARAVARLSHPNVVAIHRVGEVRRRPYLVSEYVHGLSLDQVARPMGWERALRIA